MDEKFIVTKIHICPVYKVGDSFTPDMEYPTRYCVIDEEKQIAIDIKTKLKYDYVKTVSHLYFSSQSNKKIKGDNRVAIFPYTSISYNGCDMNESRKIIEQLKSNEKFQDGNEVYDNKSYLEFLKQEALREKQNINDKVKVFRKRKK
ncbi:MAG: hypothetical protein IJE04_01540 [Bacilli bacterium]|nr:hypothetical protein [Bacilli bacterium]